MPTIQPTAPPNPPPDPKKVAMFGWIAFVIGAIFATGAIGVVVGNSGRLAIFSEWRPGMGRRGGTDSWYLVLVMAGFGLYTMYLGITQVLKARQLANKGRNGNEDSRSSIASSPTSASQPPAERLSPVLRFTIWGVLCLTVLGGVACIGFVVRRQLSPELTAMRRPAEAQQRPPQLPVPQLPVPQRLEKLPAQEPPKKQSSEKQPPKKRPARQRSKDIDSALPAEKQPHPAAVLDEFLTALREVSDWNEFKDQAADPFAKTKAADQAIPVITSIMLADPNPEMRIRAAYTLGKMHRYPEQLIPNLISALEDPEPRIRWYAADALSQFGEHAKPAIPTLLKQMHDPGSPIAAFCADALHRIDPTIDVEPSLIALLRSGVDQNRAHAVQTLGRLNAKRAKPALVDALAHETDAGIKDQISQAIVLIDSTPDSN